MSLARERPPLARERELISTVRALSPSQRALGDVRRSAIGCTLAAVPMKRLPWIASLVALGLACVVVAITARSWSSTCDALVPAPMPDVAPSALPLVAVPASPHSHQWASAHTFEDVLGEFRLACHTNYDGHYWDYDHCALEAPRCASEPLSVDGYGMFANDLALHRAADGSYVLTTTLNDPYLSFRTEPTGHRVGGVCVYFALVAAGVALVAIAVVWIASRYAGRFTGWRDGTVDANGAVVPDDGAARVPIVGSGLVTGTAVLFAPPRERIDYRSTDEPVRARRGARAELLRTCARIETLAIALAAVSAATSIAIAASVVTRT
jgi:hypothetical protein